MQKPIFYSLIPYLQTYEWGSTADNSILKKFLSKKNIVIDKPHAELWKGSHKKGPSRVFPVFLKTQKKHSDYLFESEQELDKLIKKDPEHFLGKKLAKKYNTLPFLLKILEAEKPLSIQTHPDKSFAEILHQRDPVNYPDDNHKPEIAICLDHFEAIVGFRKWEEIQEFLEIYPIKDLFYDIDYKQNLKSSFIIKNIYKRLMELPSIHIQKTAQKIINFIHKQNLNSIRDQWFKKLMEIYGDDDPGIFSIYLFQYLKLNRGEGIFLGPGIPHAYLKGTILECMSVSDNVIRGGLTRKFKDVNTLLEVLKFDDEKISVLIPEDVHHIYRVPVKDFQISVLHKPDYESVSVNITYFPCIVLILEGNMNIKVRYSENEEIYSFENMEAIFFPGDINDRGISIQILPSKDSYIFMSYTLLE